MFIITNLSTFYSELKMNSANGSSNDAQVMEASHFQKLQPVDFSLTYEQYLIIQHYLPKRFALIDHKNIKRGMVVASNVKLGPEDTQNLSRVSGNIENTQEIAGRTKRIKIKKVDKFLEGENTKTGKMNKQSQPENELQICNRILIQLKNHKSSFPFRLPVDPIRDQAPNYLVIVKQPMDLSTVESNLADGVYESAAQFHADVNKIWLNSYLFNEKGSLMHKHTADMQKYYKSLLERSKDEGMLKKSIKAEKVKVKAEKEKLKVEAPGQIELKKSETFEYFNE